MWWWLENKEHIHICTPEVIYKVSQTFLLFFQNLHSGLKSTWFREELLKALLSIMVSFKQFRDVLGRVKADKSKEVESRQMADRCRRVGGEKNEC